MNKMFAFIITLLTGLGLAGAVGAYPISEIRPEGLTPDQWESVRSISRILPGDEYDRLRTERARERIQEFLETKGYPANEVSFEVLKEGDEHVLKFKVALGEPMVISQIRFKSDPPLSPESLLKLQRSVDFKPGELFDRDRIKEMKRLAEVALASGSYIDSRVKELSTEATPAGIELTFDLELGEKVVFSVQGNRYFSRAEIIEVIEKQRAFGLGRDYVSILSNRIRDLYVERGYKRVDIKPYFFEASGNEPKKVLFVIEEGMQYKIHQIQFDGNESFTDAQLEALFFSVAPDRIRARIYNATMLDAAADSLIEELRKRGYLAAKRVAIKSEDDPATGQVQVRLFLSEGLQTRVQSVEFNGNRSFNRQQLQRSLGIAEGDPLDLAKLEDGLERIKRDYLDLGRLDFRILNESENGTSIVTYSEKNQLAYLNFDFEEGPVYTLGSVEVYGNEATRRKVIDREILIKRGDPLSQSRLLDVEDRLRRLGIFSQVSLELRDEDAATHVKRLKIAVQESVPGKTTLGIGFRNDLGIRTFGGVSYSNLWGLNHTWALDLTVNRRLNDFNFLEYTAQVSYTMPWALIGETTLRPSISAEKRQYIQFGAETFALSTSLDRMLYRPLKLSSSLAYALERIGQFNAIDPTQNQQLTIGSITPTLRLDLRDNSLSPKRGFYAQSSFEWANSFLGSQSNPVPIRYGRYQARADFYLNFVPNLVWYGSVRGGWLKNFANPYDSNGQLDPKMTVPLIKQFALGGVNSIRGFTEQEINVQSGDPDRRVQGQLTYINYRTQMDFYPTPSVSIGPFLDAGNLRLDSFSLGNLRFGSGVGLRYVTPVGPVNFDWGFKLFPQPGEAPNVFYFSLGVI